MELAEIANNGQEQVALADIQAAVVTLMKQALVVVAPVVARTQAPMVQEAVGASVSTD